MTEIERGTHYLIADSWLERLRLAYRVFARPEKYAVIVRIRVGYPMDPRW